LNVNSDRVGKETNHVNRHLSSAGRLAATALLVGVAVVACGRPNGAAQTQPTAAPTAQQSVADQPAATVQPTAADAATDTPTPTAGATDPTGASSAPAAVTTADPLDAQLSNLDNLLNGVNGSLSGSDASGGE
jgi:hypothetical protein